MISRQKIIETVKAYDPANITIGVLGGHSALDVCHGAKKYGFRTVAVCQKGREKTYDKYFRTRPDMDVVPGQLPPWRADKGVIDEVIMVENFADIVNPDIQQKLREMNTIFVHNRYFWVYCDFNKIEDDFAVPIFGTREMVKLEERHVEHNQYFLLEQAGIRIPKIFSVPEEIDRLTIVKVSEALRGYERAFFVVANTDEYLQKAKELIDGGMVTKEGLEKSVIEEFVLGAQINLNFFYSAIDDELELMGTDMRRQTNIDGLLRLPATQQMEVLKQMDPKMIEMGHVAVTMKESLIEKAFDIGEKFVDLTKREVPPGIVGPFALQGAVTAEEGKEEFVIFDVSLRIPGSPGTRFTPYSGYLYGDSISYGERIAMEVQTALKANKLEMVVT